MVKCSWNWSSVRDKFYGMWHHHCRVGVPATKTVLLGFLWWFTIMAAMPFTFALFAPLILKRSCMFVWGINAQSASCKLQEINCNKNEQFHTHIKPATNLSDILSAPPPLALLVSPSHMGRSTPNLLTTEFISFISWSNISRTWGK